MKSFLVIGLGRFGFALAVELCVQGHEVLALDLLDERIQAAADLVTRAVAGDARDPEVLRTLGARNFDCAVVAASSDVGDSALITLNLKELGVPQVVSKANSAVHRKVLEKIGADRVVFPEQEMALRLARNLANVDILNFIELSEDYSVVERRCPRQWQGRSIRALDVRAQYHINIIAVHRGEKEMLISPGGDYQLAPEDRLVLLGANGDIERMDRL